MYAYARRNRARTRGLARVSRNTLLSMAGGGAGGSGGNGG